MQGIQRTIQSIAANLRGLTPSARLFIGSLMIIALMSLFLVSLYAGRTELTSLGLRRVTDSVKAQVIDYLELNGIPYEARGDDVLVASNRKIEVLGQLADQQLIGGDQINFETLIADSSPFRSREENRQRYLVAKMNVLSGMIAQMNGIERARVVIDAPDNAGGIGRPSIPPSASVSVLTRGGELSQGQVDAIAHLVARSHAGLKPENVAVLDARSGRGLQARNDEMTALGRYLEVRQAAERHTRNALAGALDFIPGVLIEVNAQVNAADEVRQTSTMTDPASGVTEGPLRLADSPIARLDDAQRLPFIDIGSLGSRSIESSGPVLNRSESQVRDPKGYPLRINASIGVPRSYFLRLAQEQTATATMGASTLTFDALVRSECDRLREYITPLIDTQAIEGATSGAIVVTMVHDFTPRGADQPPAAPAATLMMTSGLNDLIKKVGLGALALLALMMMFLLVRRASVTPAAPIDRRTPARAPAEIEITVDERLPMPALDRLELADEAARRQQMLREVRSMIHDSPEETTESLRQWVRG